MSTDEQSKFKLYSMGLAAGNVEFGQRELEVIPIEDLSQLDGEVNDMQDTITSTGTDREGNEYQTKQTTSHSIKATFLSEDANRPYPGMVRRGEQVLIYRIGDTDKFYWKEMGLEDNVRRNDVYIIAVPNSGKENENSRSADSAYYLEVNTVDKQITLSTNKNDGEQFAYIIQLNAKDGHATIQDDAGQFIQLVSKEQRCIMANASGSEIKIEKSKALISAKDEVKIETKKLLLNAEVTEHTGKTYNYTGVDFGVASNFSMKGTNYSIAATNSVSKGGKYSVQADIDFVGALTSNGMNISDSHYHITTRQGENTTKVTG